jgi:hypothetical protein
LDVTPLSLGIETLGGVMTKLIERNTTIPTRKSEIFSTAADNQTAVTVKVLQGEREMAANNRVLGLFNLEGIPPAPRGVPQVEVTFDIDANGIVHVSAKDLGTGKEQKIRIESSSGLSKEEVEKLVKEGQANAEDDKKKHEVITARNQLDNLIYATEKTLKEHGDKISEDEKKKVEEALKEAKTSLTSESKEELEKAGQKLATASHTIAQKMYEEAAKKAGTRARQLLEPKGKKTTVSWTRIMKSSTKKKRRRKKNKNKNSRNGERSASSRGVPRSAFPERAKAEEKLMPQRMKYILLCSLLMFGLLMPLGYAAPRLKIKPPAERIPIDQRVTLTVQLEWPQTEGPYEIHSLEPMLENLTPEKQYQTQETATTVSYTFYYAFRPLKTGIAVIDAFEVSYRKSETEPWIPVLVPEQKILVVSSFSFKTILTWLAMLGGLAGLIFTGVKTVRTLKTRKAAKNIPKGDPKQRIYAKAEESIATFTSPDSKEKLTHWSNQLRTVVVTYYDVPASKTPGKRGDSLIPEVQRASGRGVERDFAPFWNN